MVDRSLSIFYLENKVRLDWVYHVRFLVPPRTQNPIFWLDINIICRTKINLLRLYKHVQDLRFLFQFFFHLYHLFVGAFRKKQLLT